MKVTVRTMMGQAIPLTVEPDDTVADVKQQLCNKEGFPHDTQRLIFAGQQLGEGRSLGDCGIEEGSTIHLLLVLKPLPRGRVFPKVGVCTVRALREFPLRIAQNDERKINQDLCRRSHIGDKFHPVRVFAVIITL